MSEKDKGLELKQIMDKSNEDSIKFCEDLERLIKNAKETSVDQQEIDRMTKLLKNSQEGTQKRIEITKKFGETL